MTRSQLPGLFLRSQRPEPGWLGAPPREDGCAGPGPDGLRPPPLTPTPCALREASGEVVPRACCPGGATFRAQAYSPPIYGWPDLEQSPHKPGAGADAGRPALELQEPEAGLSVSAPGPTSVW